MSLTAEQKAILEAAATSQTMRDLVNAAGLPDIIEELGVIYSDERKQTVETQLATAVTFTVADRVAMKQVIADGVSSTALYPIVAAIDAKISVDDDTGLGALLIALYAAEKSLRT